MSATPQPWNQQSHTHLNDTIITLMLCCATHTIFSPFFLFLAFILGTGFVFQATLLSPLYWQHILWKIPLFLHSLPIWPLMCLNVFPQSSCNNFLWMLSSLFNGIRCDSSVNYSWNSEYTSWVFFPILHSPCESCIILLHPSVPTTSVTRLLTPYTYI